MYNVSLISVDLKKRDGILSYLANHPKIDEKWQLKFVHSREESNADVEHYKKVKQAEANSKLYTDQYVKLELAKALSNNTKYFFSGEDSVIGGLLSKIMN